MKHPKTLLLATVVAAASATIIYGCKKNDRSATVTKAATHNAAHRDTPPVIDFTDHAFDFSVGTDREAAFRTYFKAVTAQDPNTLIDYSRFNTVTTIDRASLNNLESSIQGLSNDVLAGFRVYYGLDANNNPIMIFATVTLTEESATPSNFDIQETGNFYTYDARSQKFVQISTGTMNTFSNNYQQYARVDITGTGKFVALNFNAGDASDPYAGTYSFAELDGLIADNSNTTPSSSVVDGVDFHYAMENLPTGNETTHYKVTYHMTAHFNSTPASIANTGYFSSKMANMAGLCPTCCGFVPLNVTN